VARKRAERPTEFVCPFTVLVDTREGLPYTFEGLTTTAEEGNLPICVCQIRRTLPVGDYAIEGYPRGVIVERKSPPDLFQSVAKRRNMEHRLTAMNEEYEYACFVVECELSAIYLNPQSDYSPTALGRSVISWQQKYRNVHWMFCPGRRFAEQWTFRVLERYWLNTACGGKRQRNYSSFVGGQCASETS
jgi:ERCC4-type nuclease